MREEIESLTRAGLRVSLTGGERAMAEYPVAAKLKQERAQLAMHAPP